jgi:hypothetical protein
VGEENATAHNAIAIRRKCIDIEVPMDLLD